MSDKIEIINKPVVLLAYFHDGTYESAQAIYDWFLSNRESPFCSVQYISNHDEHIIHFTDYNGDKGVQTVKPGWWFIRNHNGNFITISDEEFNHIYLKKDD